MLTSYTNYTELSLHALEHNPRAADVVQKKQDIFLEISRHFNSAPTSVLFFGFNPWILSANHHEIFLTAVNSNIKKYLDSKNIKYTYIDEQQLDLHAKQFSWVVATEEFFTFAKDEAEQQQKVSLLVSLAKNQVITTLRDYKNQDFRDREFSLPLSIYNHNTSKIFLEYHNYNLVDKNSWDTTVYELDGAAVQVHGPYARRAMFFKQMAKFSIDAGAKNFYVHKNLMYKSLIRKNYEHVISISF